MSEWYTKFCFVFVLVGFFLRREVGVGGLNITQTGTFHVCTITTIVGGENCGDVGAVFIRPPSLQGLVDAMCTQANAGVTG